ncbi:MAG: acetolactate synthase small subunit [Calditerrivibrio sp.]|nr:acetolactate synthase small subunit [Calditerrivibrio sp.]MCA1933708.1 acetolactate synthase small subunit [Calditerrivibrio sp.]
MRHIISVLVENKFGVLARISGLFSGRGYNIESLSVNATENENISIMTIVTRGDDHVIDQIIKQLRKLVNTIKVRDVTQVEHVERELILVKVHATQRTRSDILNIIDTFRGKVVDINKESLVIEMTGDQNKLNALVDVLEPYGIIEIIRSGTIAIARGSKSTTDFTKQDIKNQEE